MQVEQRKWSSENAWQSISDKQLKDTAQLVFAFGNASLWKEPARFEEIRSFYPHADIITCCTDGEILNQEIHEDIISVSALAFSSTDVQALAVPLSEVKDSFDAGTHLSADLDKDFINSLIVLADSNYLLGSDLLTGLHINLSSHVPVLGGMSTGAVGLNTPPQEAQVIGIGLSGEKLHIGCAVDNTWTTIGAEKTVTKADNQRLYELDGKPVLHFYEQYLEGIVDDVKASILYHPLGIKNPNTTRRTIRSILTVHEDQSVSFAGSFRQGDQVRMMKSSLHKLIQSAEESSKTLAKSQPVQAQFILQFNCNGRRKILKDWIQQELECVNSAFGESTPLMGFYTHGEFCPPSQGEKSELHNQSVVFNTFSESE